MPFLQTCANLVVAARTCSLLDACFWRSRPAPCSSRSSRSPGWPSPACRSCNPCSTRPAVRSWMGLSSSALAWPCLRLLKLRKRSGYSRITWMRPDPFSPAGGAMSLARRGADLPAHRQPGPARHDAGAVPAVPSFIRRSSRMHIDWTHFTPWRALAGSQRSGAAPPQVEKEQIAAPSPVPGPDLPLRSRHP